MGAVGRLLLLHVGITFAPHAGAGPLPDCASGLTPVLMVAPELPRRLHNEFIGSARVSFIIGPAGDVRSPVIVSSKWQAVGRSAGQPVGYDEAVLSAVAQWRYPHRPHACRHQAPVELQVDGAKAAGVPIGQAWQQSDALRAGPASWPGSNPIVDGTG